MATNSCQINTFTNSLSQLYNHLQKKNVNMSVEIILKTKHNSHMIFTTNSNSWNQMAALYSQNIMHFIA